jgi:hypothetical protein
VNVAPVEGATRVADLPLDATVALAKVASVIKDGLLAFASATGLVVMHQMMQAELNEVIGGDRSRIEPPNARATGRDHQGLGRASA